MIKRPELGHLSVGAEADIAVLGAAPRHVRLPRQRRQPKMMGDQKLECELTIKAGQVVWDLNGLSRPMWNEAK